MSEIDPERHHHGSVARPPHSGGALWRVVVIGGLCGVVGALGGVAAALGLSNSPESITAAAGPTTPVVAVPTVLATAPPTAGDGRVVTYEVLTADRAELASIVYFDANNETRRAPDRTSPWSKTVSNTSTVAMVGISVQTTGSDVTCRIVVDGKVAEEKTATGRFAVATCSSAVK